MGKFLLVVLLVAVAVYVAVRLLQRRGGSPGGGRSRPSRPVAPDDDPDFLRDLDTQQWRERRDRLRRGGDGEPGESGEGSEDPHER